MNRKVYFEIKKKEELQEISCHQFSSNNRSNEQEIVELEDKYHKKINVNDTA